MAIVLRRAGLTIEEIRDLCRVAILSAETAPKRANYIPPSRDSALLGSALALWHRDPGYLKKDGSPLPLTLRGRARSIESLLRAAGLRTKTREAANFLRRAGLLVPATRGRFLPLGRAARMPSMNAHFVEHIALGLMKLLQTVTYNFTPTGKERPILQRAAAIRQLPRRFHKDFRQFVNEQGNAFVTNVDDWLEARASRSKGTNRKSAPAGVYAFAYLG